MSSEEGYSSDSDHPHGEVYDFENVEEWQKVIRSALPLNDVSEIRDLPTLRVCKEYKAQPIFSKVHPSRMSKVPSLKKLQVLMTTVCVSVFGCCCIS